MEHVEQATAAPGEKRNLYLTPIEDYSDEELIEIAKWYLRSLRGTSGHLMALQEQSVGLRDE